MQHCVLDAADVKINAARLPFVDPESEFRDNIISATERLGRLSKAFTGMTRRRLHFVHCFRCQQSAPEKNFFKIDYHAVDALFVADRGKTERRFSTGSDFVWSGNDIWNEKEILEFDRKVIEPHLLFGAVPPFDMPEGKNVNKLTKASHL